MEILVFGGTSEARELVEWLDGRHTCTAVVCSATEYGTELVSRLERIEAHTGPLDARAKERLVDEHDFSCIVDATHPFATHVSESLKTLAESRGLPLLRLVREDEPLDGCTVVDDTAQAAAVLAQRSGNVLLTTGSKELGVFTAGLPDFAERLYARILPVESSVAHARDLGIAPSHIVAMQGPFSAAFNEALMRELDIAIMVTKASGAAGGFGEKIEAARRLGVEAVVIGRPAVEEGLALADLKSELEVRYGI